MRSKANNYPFVYYVDVEFRDLDPMGHVNNAVYFTFIESARIHFFRKFLDVERSPLDMPLILAEATCTYKSPAVFGERLTIGVGITEFGRKSFRMAYRIDGQDGRLVARGHTAVVMYDYSVGQSVEVPAEFKQQVYDFQKGWVIQPLKDGELDR